MARIVFPTNKSSGSEHNHGNRKYRFDGKRWRKVNTQAENAAANITTTFNAKQADLDAKKAELEAEVDAKKAELDAKKAELDNTVSGMQSNVTTNASDISTNATAIASLQSSISNMSTGAFNYASDENWTVASSISSMPDTNTGGAFTSNGDDGEHRTELLTGPRGDWRVCWHANNNDTTSNGDGGWNKLITGLDPSKGYMSVVYVRRTSSGVNGSFYHGCDGSGNTLNVDGSVNTNPYFSSGLSISHLPVNTWCVSIGFILPNSDTTSMYNYQGGVFRLDNGTRISVNNTYRMNTGTVQNHRTYLFYSNGPANDIMFADPGFFEINESSPTVGSIVGAAHQNGPRGCQVFTSSGTWNRAFWCQKVIVEVIGGGGGASGYSESGGAGGYASEIINNPAASVSVTVGGGGGSTQYYAAAGNGGTSSFGGYCSASGGYGANRNAGHSGGAGGIGSGAHVNTRGGGGTGHTNSNASGSPAKGGASYMGGGAGDNRGASNSKISHGAPGSGGPGSRGDTGWRGAPGESGIVIVWEYE